MTENEHYSYGNERVDPRTLTSDSEHLWIPGQKPKSYQAQAEDDDEMLSLINLGVSRSQSVADIEKLERQVERLVDLVAQSSDKTTDSDERLLKVLEKLEQLMNPNNPLEVLRYLQAQNQTQIPSQNVQGFSQAYSSNQVFNPYGQGQGQGQVQPQNFSFPDLGNASFPAEPEIPEPGEQEVWAKVLNEAARLELAGVCLYSFYATILVDPAYIEFFKESAQEGILHYERNQELILYLGKKDRLALAPTLELLSVPMIPATLKDLPASAFPRMAEHEAKALETYRELGALVSGKDWVLENFALTQAEEEARHLVQLKKMAGLV